MDFSKILFSAYGRIGRQEFWLAWLMLFGIGLITAFIPIVHLVAWMFTLYCGICIRSQRLHDMGRTGWWQVVPVVAGTAAWMMMIYVIIALALTWSHVWWVPHPAAVAGTALGVTSMVLAILASWIIDLAFLLWIGISESDPYDNVYGPARWSGGAALPA